MKNKRMQKMLIALAETGRVADLSQWADLYKVSKRTIQNDLQEVRNMIVSDYHLNLTKSGKDYLIAGSSENLKRFAQERYKGLVDFPETDSRQLAIMKKLLVLNETISYQQLSDHFFVSRSSIAADMKQVRKYFEVSQAPLTMDHQGTSFKGDEYEIQEVLRHFLIDYARSQSGDERLLKQLYGYFFDEALVNDLLDIHTAFLKRIKTQMNEQNAWNIQTAMISLVCRGLVGERLEGLHDVDSFGQLREMTTYLFALEIAEQVEGKTGFNFSKSDLLYLNKILIASGVEPVTFLVNTNSHYQHLIGEAIVKMSVSMGVNLRDDLLLHEGLVSHIMPMIYRIQHDIQIKNPLLEVIKSKYSVMYGLTWFVMMDLEKELAINLSEDEVAFIMVHFQAAIERKRQTLRVLFVCPNGYGTSSLLASQIRQILPNIESYETLSLGQLEDKDLSVFDFVISTITLAVPDKKIIKVSPILTQRDVKMILDKYGDWFIERSDNFKEPLSLVSESSLISDVLQVADIYVTQEFQTKEGVLDFLCSELEKDGQVMPDFRQSIFGRESLAPTNISNGVAVPHGNPHFVHRSKVKIVVNSRKIPWGDEDIDVVIMLAITKEDVAHIEPMLMRVFKMIYDRGTVEKIFKQKSQQIYHSILLDDTYD